MSLRRSEAAAERPVTIADNDDSMAANLIRVDCSTSCIPVCQCGWRGATVPTRGEANRLADRHRLEQHRAAYLTAQRVARYKARTAAGAQ